VNLVDGKSEPQKFGCDHVRNVAGLRVDCCAVCHETNNGEVYFVMGGARHYLCCCVSTGIIECGSPGIQFEIEDIGPVRTDETKLYLIISQDATG
jgi:hypothetical protein